MAEGRRFFAKNASNLHYKCLIISEKKVKRLNTDNRKNLVYICSFGGPEAATML